MAGPQRREQPLERNERRAQAMRECWEEPGYRERVRPTMKEACAGRGQMLTVQGECRPISEWGRIKGLTTTQIRQRLKRGWSHEDAVLTPFGPDLLTVRGVARSVTDWSDVTGIKSFTIWKRLQYGWSPEDAVLRPLRKKRGEKKDPKPEQLRIPFDD
jgi:hypothetical protein